MGVAGGDLIFTAHNWRSIAPVTCSPVPAAALIGTVRAVKAKPLLVVSPFEI